VEFKEKWFLQRRHDSEKPIITELIIPREMDGPEKFGHEENKSGPHALQNYAGIFAAFRRVWLLIK
jgi:hypothetical protein